MDAIDMVLILFIAGICVGVVEMIKQVGLPTRYAGVASVLVGAVLTVVAGLAELVEGNVWLLLLMGVLAGLAGAGLWSAPKAVAQG